MSDRTEIIATCGCVCTLRADYNRVDECLEDIEINIETPCLYHTSIQPKAVYSAIEIKEKE